jgi:hypothetical protein
MQASRKALSVHTMHKRDKEMTKKKRQKKEEEDVKGELTN